MAKYSHDVIIIGGGAGGLVATVGCSRLGLKTALIESNRLGGDCLYYGCVPSKTLLKSAGVYQQAKQFTQYGLPPTTLPPVDLAKVMERVHQVVEDIAAHDTPERFKDYGAEVLTGEARFVSEHQVRINDRKTISAPYIIVATGSSPAIPPIPGINEVEYITNVNVFDMKVLPARLTVIGAGPIGIEMSHAFARLGSKVTVVDIAPSIMINDDPDMTAVIQQELEQCGVTFMLGVKVERVAPHNGGQRLFVRTLQKNQADAQTDAQEKTIEIDSDTLLVATGRKPNTENLDLTRAGVRTERNAIITNSKLQSSVPHILAIGDCNGKMLFTHVAGAEGSVAVRRVALRVGGTMNYHAVPWVTYTDPELASVGYNQKMATKQNIKYNVIKEELAENDRAKAEGTTQGYIKMLVGKKDVVLGVQIVGAHAGDLILPSLAAVTQKSSIRNLMNPVYPYPTVGEIYKRAIGNYLAPRLFNNKVRQILKLLYKYRGSTS